MFDFVSWLICWFYRATDASIALVLLPYNTAASARAACISIDTTPAQAYIHPEPRRPERRLPRPMSTTMTTPRPTTRQLNFTTSWTRCSLRLLEDYKTDFTSHPTTWRLLGSDYCTYYHLLHWDLQLLQCRTFEVDETLLHDSETESFGEGVMWQ